MKMMLIIVVVVSHAFAASAYADCTYNGQSYSDGSVTCQGGYEYKCNGGSWDSLNTTCSK
jgi:hypothetical protein